VETISDSQGVRKRSSAQAPADLAACSGTQETD
jgi:hypothetical protein